MPEDEWMNKQDVYGNMEDADGNTVYANELENNRVYKENNPEMKLTSKSKEAVKENKDETKKDIKKKVEKVISVKLYNSPGI